MALDKEGLTANLLTLYNQAKASEITEADFAAGVADAIDTYVKTATVNVTSVSGVTPGGGVSGPGSGTLS